MQRCALGAVGHGFLAVAWRRGGGCWQCPSFPRFSTPPKHEPEGGRSGSLGLQRSGGSEPGCGGGAGMLVTRLLTRAGASALWLNLVFICHAHFLKSPLKRNFPTRALAESLLPNVTLFGGDPGWQPEPQCCLQAPPTPFLPHGLTHLPGHHVLRDGPWSEWRRCRPESQACAHNSP